jgi:hypothetical protein
MSDVVERLNRFKTLEVWHVEFSNAKGCGPRVEVRAYESKVEAEDAADMYRQDQWRRCIRVTGPHQQEVPA